MLVVLDANVIVADSLLSGTVWRVLAHAFDAWGVRIAVPKVALAEADAVIARKAKEAIFGLQRATEAARRLGLPVPDDLVTSAAEAAEVLKQQLADQFGELGVEIIDPPAVDHMTLVQRAASRTKPCNDKGDGYRDTLIWLTIVDLANQTDEPVAFVTNNVQDFADLSVKDDLALHPHLVKELAAADLADQVTLFRKLDDLVMALAAKHSPTAPTDLSEVGRELERAKAVGHITSQVVPTLSGRSISPSRCGLPRYVASASIQECASPEDIEIIATHPEGADSLASFSFSASVSIAAEVLLAADVDGEATERTPEQITKTLRFSGFLTRDQFERPTSAEITEIAAMPGDPGLAAWASRGHPAWLSQIGAPAVPFSAIQAILDAQKTAGGPHPSWMKSMADLQKIIGAAATPPWMKSMADLQKDIGSEPAAEAAQPVASPSSESDRADQADDEQVINTTTQGEEDDEPETGTNEHDEDADKG